MKRTRLLSIGGFTGLLCLGFLLTRGDAQPNTVKKIAEGIWFREGDIKNQGHCNNAIIEMKDYLIVVDANFPSGARLVLEDAKKVSSKPVKYVFDTHHHGDHSYGNAVWTKQGAVTIAYAGVAEEMKRYEPGRWKDTAKGRPDVGELNLKTAEPPQQTFKDSPHIMKDDSREVRFYFFGWAHTRGDGFVYVPKEKVLCTGDAATNGPYNYTADGNIGNWPKVMEAAQKLDVKYVLPGHGPSGGPEILQGQHDFMVELMKAVSDAVKQGKGLNDLVKMDGEKPVAAIMKMPDSVQNWVGDSLPGQIQDAYTEVTKHKPVGAIKHK